MFVFDLPDTTVCCYIRFQGSLAACEFLLLSSASLDTVDDDQRTALHHATLKGHTAQVCQLLKKGADYKLTDSSGRNALSLAVEAEQADIVTLYVH